MSVPLNSILLFSGGLVPNDILSINDANYHRSQSFIDQFFRSKVDSTPELVQKFEEFFSSEANQSLFCGVNKIICFQVKIKLKTMIQQNPYEH